MEFRGEFGVAVSPAETWEFMLDPERIGSCLPNCQNIEVIDEHNDTAEIGVSVSKISVTFDVDAEIIEQREEEYLQVRLTGNAKSWDSRMESTVEIQSQRARTERSTSSERTRTTSPAAS
jgi:carbon monoxide dehydrogenase subunit G